MINQILKKYMSMIRFHIINKRLFLSIMLGKIEELFIIIKIHFSRGKGLYK